MRKQIFLVAAILLHCLLAFPVFAAQMRLFVTDMGVTGVQNRDEMKQTLQILLASRLNSDQIIVVGSEAEAEALVSGSYIVMGNSFSIDATVKEKSGKILARAFVQGEGQDTVIASVGKLAEKLSGELAKTPVASTPVAAKPDIITPREQVKSADAGWLSKRLDGASNLIAAGSTLPDGSRELFLAAEHRIAYFLQNDDVKLVAEADLKDADKIVSLDTIQGDHGAVDIYLTVVRFGELASQVWQVQDKKLVQVAKDLPYYFRTISLVGETKKLYAQEMGREDDFYGDVKEVTRTGNRIAFTRSIKMPRYGTIYSFNQFRTKDGSMFMTVISPDGYLIVYDQQLNELWRSTDQFGGSELYFQRPDDSNVRVSGDRYRWIFMNQRIQVSPNGTILVGKNDGFLVLGNARNYKSGAVYGFTWNGSSLEEKWHTRVTQNYMPDYLFDPVRNEVLILQTVQRQGMTTRGGSSLTSRKVE